MNFRRKRDKDPEKKTPEPSSARPGEKISVRDVSGTEKPVRRTFPGPRGAHEHLRVAVERSAYAELIAHAKESLEAEVCGVLAGRICEDDEGKFVHVEAVIRGAAASGGSTHVTFTQATWTAIHQTLERDHPKLRMVGWYHTHPGFGVEFSDMDLFIQGNFFSGPAQIALVTDPLSGAVAICVNTLRGIEYVPRFWVDGREQPCRVPDRNAAAPGATVTLPSGDLAASVKALEARISQLVQVVDEQSASFHRFLLTAGMCVCLGIIAAVGYVIYSQLRSRVEPPRNIGFAPVPVQIGDHSAMLGVNVVSWQLPPELDPVQVAIEQFKRELAAQLAGTNAAGGATNTASPTNPPPSKTGNPPKPAK